MIRVFVAFRKSFFNKISDILLFKQSIEDFKMEEAVCPHCGAKHSCAPFPSYTRYIICLEANKPICHQVEVPRILCTSCNHTHAILPDCLVPFSSYSLSFILTVLQDYFLRKQPVLQLCSQYQISVSTLYAWIHQFVSHKKLWLGILRNAAISSCSFLESLLASDFSTSDFFQTFLFSFLQFAFTTHSDSS